MSAMSTLQDGPVASTSSARATRLHIDEDMKRDAQGFVKSAIELLGVAASMTQNVPYLGIVSGILTEVVKIEDEVDTYKQDWRATMTIARQIKAVVDNILQQCSSTMGNEDVLPDALKEPFDSLEKCLVRTLETLDACQARTAEKQSLSRTKRLKARIRERINRKGLLNEVKECRRRMQAALHLFNTKLQIDQSLQIHAMAPILAEVREAQRVQAASSQAEPSATTIYSMEPVPAAPAIFHGRAREIDHIVDLIESSVSARIAILGPGGIGKTSVALAVLHHPAIERMFAPRRYFVSCEALPSADGIAQELLRTFGLVYDARSGLQLHDYLLFHLRTFSRTMLCLDNLETPWDTDVQSTETLLSKLAELPQFTLLITSRGSDRPLQVAWSQPILAPLEPLSLDAALATWDAICGSHDEHSTKLVLAIDCVPLAVTLLAHLAESETSQVLWERWQDEQTELLRTRGSSHRLTNVDVSIQLSLCSPRLRDSDKACVFLAVLCALPQGIPESRMPIFLDSFVEHLPDLRRSITLLKQCSLAYLTHDGRLRVLSPVRHYMHTTHPIPDTLLICLFNHYRGIFTFPANDYQAEKNYAEKNIRAELGNISDVFGLCLDRIHELRTVIAPIDVFKAVHNFLFLSHTLLHYETHVLDRAIKIIGQYSLPVVEARLWTLKGISQFDLLSTRDALDSLTRAMDVFRSADDKQGEADCLAIMSDVCHDLDWIQTAEDQLVSALRLYDSLENHHGGANARLKLGRLYVQLGRSKEAYTMIGLAITVLTELRDSLGYANGMQTMGELYIRQGQFDDAEILLKKGLKEHRELGDLRGEAATLVTLGSLYYNTSRVNDAKHLLLSALDMYRKIGDRLGEASVLELLGAAYQRLDELESAEQCLKAAIPLHQLVGSCRGEAKTLNRLGHLYRQLHRYAEAQAILEAALLLSDTVGYSIGRGNAYRNMGLLCRDIDDFGNAESNFRRALSIFSEAQHTEKIKATEKDLEILFTLRLRSAPHENIKSHSDPETCSLRRSSSRASSVGSRFSMR